MPVFSIIVPVYNVQRYIGRCIESILSQSYTDFELILVDDGSQDNSGKICDQYAMCDDRILVIHQKNRGVSAARNAGLYSALGKYIVFVDSDDLVDENYLECMAKETENVDMVICGMKFVDEQHLNYQEICYEKGLYKELSNEEILKIIDNKSIDYVVNKRFKRKKLLKEKICFQETMNLSEDTLFVANYLRACKNVQYVDQTPYRYYKYKENTLSSFNENYIKKMELADKKIVRCLEEQFGDIQDTLIWKRRCFSNYYYSIFYILKNKRYTWREKYKLLKSICGENAFREFKLELDIYMYKDSKIIRKIIATGRPLIILVMWKIVDLKGRQK